MWNLNCDTNELIYATETDSDIESKLTVTKGGGGVNWEYHLIDAAYYT